MSFILNAVWFKSWLCSLQRKLTTFSLAISTVYVRLSRRVWATSLSLQYATLSRKKEKREGLQTYARKLRRKIPFKLSSQIKYTFVQYRRFSEGLPIYIFDRIIESPLWVYIWVVWIDLDSSWPICTSPIPREGHLDNNKHGYSCDLQQIS